MSNIASRLPQWLPEAARNDPKKAGILGALLIVLAIAIIRYFLITSGPAVASARPITKTTPQKAGEKAAVATSTASAASRAWIKKSIPVFERNLFLIKPEYYPARAGRFEQAQKTLGTGIWDAIEKSRTEQADQKKRREILVENLQREAAKLKLQSTVMGPEPQAIIGGSLVKEGDVVASDTRSAGIQFRVLTIEARRVIVEREGIRLAIHMQQ